MSGFKRFWFSIENESGRFKEALYFISSKLVRHLSNSHRDGSDPASRNHRTIILVNRAGKEALGEHVDESHAVKPMFPRPTKPIRSCISSIPDISPLTDSFVHRADASASKSSFFLWKGYPDPLHTFLIGQV